MKKLYNVIILGSGGRESAFAWSISQSPKLQNLYCVPGNPGTAEIAQNIDADINDFAKIAAIAQEVSADIIVTGPEEPLVRGIRDFFGEHPTLSRIMFIGPCKRGALLEGSKEWAKEFMARHKIPTAPFKSFKSDQTEEAVSYIKTLTPPYVLKADGLAAGKGVIILNSEQEAVDEVKVMLDGKFGKASERVVIEEFLSGLELSVFILTDGENYILLPEAKDYKRVGDGDSGPNTGGMGAVSPVFFADQKFMEKVEKKIIMPTINGLKSEKIPYKGFIFFGLINCKGEPFVIEYNVRMGDPETEAVLPRIKSDLLGHLLAAAKGELAGEKVVISEETSMTGIAVSGGYPGDYAKGYRIDGLENVGNALLFHSGTKLSSEGVVTAGGRVLAVTVLGDGVANTREKLYKSMEMIHFKDIYFRKDLGIDLLENI